MFIGRERRITGRGGSIEDRGQSHSDAHTHISIYTHGLQYMRAFINKQLKGRGEEFRVEIREE